MPIPQRSLRRAAPLCAAWMFPLYMFAAASLAPAQTTGNIATIAGYGNLCANTTDNIGDGCPANNARLNFPYGLAIDSMGSLIIADSGNYRLRKVDAASNTISVLAGAGSPTNPAPVYTFALALDAQGNYVISKACSISKFNAATGVMSLFAGNDSCGYSGDGGPATSAGILAGQGSIVFDKQGNLYIADQGNNVVRKVAAATGTITTVAGNCVPGANCPGGYSGDNGPATSALLNYPSGLAFDPLGNLFISDTSNYVIRRVDANTGIITTIAGNGTSSYTGDGGPAAASQLSYPGHMTSDTAGDLYFIDNNVIRKIDTTGVISTVVGNGSSGLTATSGVATALPFQYITDLALDANQNLFFTDGLSDRVFRVDASSHQLSAVAGNAFGCQSQTDVVGDGCLAFLAQTENPEGLLNSGGALLIADLNDARLRRIDLGTGLIGDVLGNGILGVTGNGGPASQATISALYDVAQDGAGNLFIDEGGTDIRRVDATSGIITAFAGNGSSGYSGDGGPATAAEIYFVRGIASDWVGNLYIADYGNNRIRRVDAKTGIITTVAGDGTCNSSGDGSPAGAAELCRPNIVRLDNAGDVYFSDRGLIRRIDAVTGIITTVAGNLNQAACTGAGGLAVNAGIGPPYGIALDGANNLYFADDSCAAIGRVDAATGILTIVAGLNNRQRGYTGDGGPATQAEITTPRGVALDQAGNLYFNDVSNLAIREVYGIAVPLVTPTPAIAPATGSYAAPVSVTLSDPITSAAIYYTTNGSTPSATHGTKYTRPISVRTSETIAAVAVATGYTTSAVVSAAYTILKPQTITFAPVRPVTYGVSPIALSATASSGLPVSFSVLSGPATVSGTNNSTLTITGAGTVVVVANQVGNGFYKSAPQIVRNISVNKAMLTVTANNLSMKKGAAVPTLTYAITGLVNGDTQSGATTGQPALSTRATSKSALGKYPIIIAAGTLAAPNYRFTFVRGTLTVTN